MGSGKERKRRNDNTVPCACGCGTLIYQYGTDGRVRRFARGHQFKGNIYGQKSYCLDDILRQAEPMRPFCQCGCGEKLGIPEFLQQKGKGLGSIQSYWRRHPFKKGHGNWQLRTENYLAEAGKLSTETLGLIYGTLLGDGAIAYPNQHSRFPRLAWTHSTQQTAWMEYKAARLQILRPKLKFFRNQGYGKQSIGCRTACHPDLQTVFNIVRPQNTQKSVTAQWLSQISEEGWAWWYLDDGSLSLSPQGSPQIQFHTEGYSGAENQLIAERLTDMGYPSTARSYVRQKSGKRYYYVAMGADAARQWLSNLQQYAIPSMAYKFGDGRIYPPRWP
jgi:hypothetical protein